MRSALKPVFCAVAFLAMAYGQVFGLYRNYIAEVEGIRVETVADHHHEGDDLDSDHFVSYTPHAHHHHDHDDEESEERPVEEHVPNMVELDAPKASAPAEAPFVPVHFVWYLPDFLLDATVAGASRVASDAPPDRGGGLSPPACLQVVRCTVLLV